MSLFRAQCSFLGIWTLLTIAMGLWGHTGVSAQTRRLRAASRTRMTMTGVVTDAQGQPLPQARVCVWNYTQHGLAFPEAIEANIRERGTSCMRSLTTRTDRFVQTDAQGRFSATLPNEGVWAVTASADGKADFTTNAVQLLRGQARDVTLQLLDAHTFEGVIVDEQSQSAGPRGVTLRLASKTWWVRTDAQGHFRLAGVPDASGAISVDSYSGLLLPVADLPITADAPTRIVLAQGRSLLVNACNAMMRNSTDASIQFQVDDQPAHCEHQNFDANGCTAYRIDRLTQGPHRVIVGGDGFAYIHNVALDAWETSVRWTEADGRVIHLRMALPPGSEVGATLPTLTITVENSPPWELPRALLTGDMIVLAGDLPSGATIQSDQSWCAAPSVPLIDGAILQHAMTAQPDADDDAENDDCYAEVEIGAVNGQVAFARTMRNRYGEQILSGDLPVNENGEPYAASTSSFSGWNGACDSEVVQHVVRPATGERFTYRIRIDAVVFGCSQ